MCGMLPPVGVIEPGFRTVLGVEVLKPNVGVKLRPDNDPGVAIVELAVAADCVASAELTAAP